MQMHNEPDDETRLPSARILPNSLLPAWPSYVALNEYLNYLVLLICIFVSSFNFVN